MSDDVLAQDLKQGLYFAQSLLLYLVVFAVIRADNDRPQKHQEAEQHLRIVTEVLNCYLFVSVHLYDRPEAEYQAHFEGPELGLERLTLLDTGHKLHQYVQGRNQLDAVIELVEAELLGSAFGGAVRGNGVRPKFKYLRGLLWNLFLTHHLLIHLNLELLVLLYGFMAALHPFYCEPSQVTDAAVQV